MGYSTRRQMGEALRTGKLNQEGLSFVTGQPVAEGPLPSRADRLAPAIAPVTGSVSMTFRIPTELCARLCTAAAERKLRRERPFSQQDIVAEALAEWFNGHPGSA